MHRGQQSEAGGSGRSFEGAAVGMAHVSLEGRFLRVNPALCSLLRRSRRELLATTYQALTHHEDLAEDEQNAQRLLAGEAATYSMQKRYDLGDGGTTWASLHVSLLRRPDGVPDCFLAVICDISAQKRAEAELQRRIALAEAACTDLESFSYSVSHDLRAPLRAIRGFSDLIARRHGEALGPDGRRLLSTVQSNAARMAQIIEALLGFSHLGRCALRWEPVDMTNLVAEVVRDELGSSREDLEEPVEIELGVLPPVPGDGVLLRQVWANLLGNAVKYSAGRMRPRVRVWGEAHDEVCRYFVQDNGVGFDPEQAPRLFAAFQRLHSAFEFDGVGLGLAVAQRIVARHGGSIAAESEPGVGSTFRFELPLSAPEPKDDSR
jgi:PAS domain S-box-containing protein